jgi:hypothetical protein
MPCDPALTDKKLLRAKLHEFYALAEQAAAAADPEDAARPPRRPRRTGKRGAR